MGETSADINEAKVVVQHPAEREDKQATYNQDYDGGVACVYPTGVESSTHGCQQNEGVYVAQSSQVAVAASTGHGSKREC